MAQQHKANRALGAALVLAGAVIAIVAIIYILSSGSCSAPSSYCSCNSNGCTNTEVTVTFVIGVVAGMLLLAAGVYKGGWQNSWWWRPRWWRGPDSAIPGRSRDTTPLAEQQDEARGPPFSPAMNPPGQG